MLQSLKERFEQEDEGFTLIELMVVVLIIAILLAIAIPTFLGARDAANARAAQSDLRNALTAEQTYWTNNQSWDVAPNVATAGSVAATETSLQWSANTGATTVLPGNNVLVTDDTAANTGVILTAASKDNHCYSIEVIDQPGGTTGAAAGTYYFDSGNVAASTKGCTAPTVAVLKAGPAVGSAASSTNQGKAWATTF
jgi:type IV pilus assembly protein PilA